MAPSLAIVGVGLIGSSLARALRANAWQGEIIGIDRDESALQEAQRLGIIDRRGDLSCIDADLLLLSVPVADMRSVLEAARESGWPGPGQFATDTGSVKKQVLDDVRALFKKTDWFVPGHPIAGSEEHGVAAGRADLFQGQLVLLTPPAGVVQKALALVTDIWQSAGAKVEQMSALEHDRLLAQTSHLPHLLAYALVDTLASGADGDRVFDYAAGGFRDFTRIAASDPLMWQKIFQSNRQPLLQSLAELEEKLRLFRRLLENNDGHSLLGHLEAAREARRQFVSRQKQGAK